MEYSPNTLDSIQNESTEANGNHLILESFPFHLLSGEKDEGNFYLDFEGEGSEPPNKQEITSYIHQYVRGYIFSRWLEIVLVGKEVSGIINPIDSCDWTGDKIIQACGGKCPVIFSTQREDCTNTINQMEGKDALILYIGDIDFDGEFLPFVNTTFEYMLNNTEKVFLRNAVRRGIALRQIMVASIMEFTVTGAGRRGVIMNGSLIPQHISYKIMKKYKENSLKKGGGKKGIHTPKEGIRGIEKSTIERINYSLRI